jgi:hypothetical protein
MHATNHLIIKRSMPKAFTRDSMDLLQLELPHLWSSYDDLRYLPHDSRWQVLQSYNVHGRLSISCRLHNDHNVRRSLSTQLTDVGSLAYFVGKLGHGSRHRVCNLKMGTCWCSPHWNMARWVTRSHLIQSSIPHFCKRKPYPRSMVSNRILCSSSSRPLDDILRPCSYHCFLYHWFLCFH